MIAANRALGRGVSFGNALDAPVEGAWGEVIEDAWFDQVAKAGFVSVRIPVRWSAHARSKPPFTIDEALFERVDHLIAQARRAGLSIILDVHHYRALMDDPAAHGPRFVTLWRQISERYAGQPHDVFFELLNEPSGAFDDAPAHWNELLATALKAIRRTNPRRPVIVGPVGHNDIGRLDELVLPPDPDLIVSVHFYAPMPFTHQGASFVEPPRPIGVEWWPDQLTLEVGIENQSWDTVVTPARKALTIEFTRRLAGFSLRLPVPLDPARLQMRIKGKAKLSIGCSSDGDLDWVNELVNERSDWVTMQVPLDACPVGTRRIGLMNRLPEAAEIELGELALCDADQCRSQLIRADEAMRKQLHQASAWGLVHGRAMHLGEFGVYDMADPDSRVRWTAEVQRIARDADLSTAYWAFGTRFGIYNSDTGAWREPLLHALLPP